MSFSINQAQEMFDGHVKSLQNEISDTLKKLDPQIEITEDIWHRVDHQGLDGGGGITRAFQGEFFENAGVNTSKVYGSISPEFAKHLKTSPESKLWAAGISLIIHPKNPRVPSVHANFRMIQVGEKHWFGGGADLTPFYPYVDDFKYFHSCWKTACQSESTYQEMKKVCDEYFVNHHREGEMRGIGGIFFDHYNTKDLKKDFEFVVELSKHFIPSYFPIVEKRFNENWTKEDEDFQLHRRGRYVEFNLLHDRGTAFGLKSNGRTESILISLPARCRFRYNYQPTHPDHLEMMKYYYPNSWA